MPGKRYNLRITKGPFAGLRARPERQQDEPTHLRVVTETGVLLYVEHKDLQRIANKTPRRKGTKAPKQKGGRKNAR